MRKILLTIFIITGVLGLFLEQYRNVLGIQGIAVKMIDYLLILYLVSDFVWSLSKSLNKKIFLRRNLFSFLFLVFYLIMFIINLLASHSSNALNINTDFLTIFRNILLVLKIFGRFRKVSNFIQSIITKPAQTVVFSFIMVILIGSLILMMPIMSHDTPLSPINALFTVTSAVCVTGLVVLDTAQNFTWIGKTVILILIQIGGLGIMLLSFFMIFLFKQSLSIKDKNLLSYMLDSKNIQSLKKSVIRIIVLTFLIEMIGAILLFPVFLKNNLSIKQSLFYSVFHSVSAFCNAGFALFSDSLTGFSHSFAMNLIIAGLIIAGGLSFAVLTDLFSFIKSRIKRKSAGLSINSKVVLIVTGLLTLTGTLVIYKLEHTNLLYPSPVRHQYLMAFFQSVTLRTAGFNTMAFDKMTSGTLMLMLGIMFIGGASGSTAGGIKVNTLGVVWAYIRSFRRGNTEILLYRHQIQKDTVLQAFTVIVFGLLSIFIAGSVLMITENAPPIDILFEVVSAFATVGLSTGITGNLTVIGKVGIILLMFLGRLGPLTLLTASSGKERQTRISYPEASIMIG